MPRKSFPSKSVKKGHTLNLPFSGVSTKRSNSLSADWSRASKSHISHLGLFPLFSNLVCSGNFIGSPPPTKLSRFQPCFCPTFCKFASSAASSSQQQPAASGINFWPTLSQFAQKLHYVTEQNSREFFLGVLFSISDWILAEPPTRKIILCKLLSAFSRICVFHRLAVFPVFCLCFQLELKRTLVKMPENGLFEARFFGHRPVFLHDFRNSTCCCLNLAVSSFGGFSKYFAYVFSFCRKRLHVKKPWTSVCF